MTQTNNNATLERHVSLDVQCRTYPGWKKMRFRSLTLRRPPSAAVRPGQTLRQGSFAILYVVRSFSTQQNATSAAPSKTRAFPPPSDSCRAFRALRPSPALRVGKSAHSRGRSSCSTRTAGAERRNKLIFKTCARSCGPLTSRGMSVTRLRCCARWMERVLMAPGWSVSVSA